MQQDWRAYRQVGMPAIFWHFVEGRPATLYIIYSRTYWGEYCCWSPLPHFFGRCRGCSCTSPPGPQVSSTETSGCCIRAAYMQTFAAVEKKQTSTSTLGASISTQVSSSFTSAAVISTSRARDETDPHNTKQGQKQANKQANKQARKQTNKQTNKHTNHANNQTSKQIHEQTNKQTYETTNKQTNKTQRRLATEGGHGAATE